MYLFVHALTGKRLELSTPNLVHVYIIAVARKALTQKSKDQRSRSHSYENYHGVRLLVTMAGIPKPCAVLPAAVAGVGLHVDTTAYVFYCLVFLLSRFTEMSPTPYAGVSRCAKCGCNCIAFCEPRITRIAFSDLQHDCGILY